MSTVPGKTYIEDLVFPDRFDYLEQLKKLSVCCVREGKRVSIVGTPELGGGFVRATDIRGAAALVLLANFARGEGRHRDSSCCQCSVDSLLFSDRDDFGDEVEIDSFGSEHFASASSGVGRHDKHWVDESVNRCLLDVIQNFVDV